MRWLQAEGSEPHEIASLYSLLGETEQAFAWLRKAYDRHSPRMAEFNQESAFDNIRSDLRFSELLRRLNLQK